LTDPDLQAIATYLRSVPAIHDAADIKSRSAWGQPSQDDATLRGIAPVSNSVLASGGAELFSGNCASCHSASGSGVKDGYYPSLFNNSTVGARDPSNLLMVILNGVQRHSKETANTKADDIFMPGFADQLSDAQIATLTTYVVQQYGHSATPAITAEQVGKQRKNEVSNAASDLLSTVIAFVQDLWRRVV
ncbi:MAG: cytochrome c, partial [Glaciimonas sp.]|nr:cytochrome c [Glaciimonas sp.]